MEMDRDTAAALYDVYERALKVLTEAEPKLLDLPDHPDRKTYILAHARVITDILCDLQAPLLRQHPQLQPAPVPGPADTELDAEEQQAVASMSEAQVARIDAALLSYCVPTWRKVARILGTVLKPGPDGLSEVPFGYLVQRVQALVASGQLESAGNLDHARYSEVRLPK